LAGGKPCKKIVKMWGVKRPDCGGHALMNSLFASPANAIKPGAFNQLRFGDIILTLPFKMAHFGFQTVGTFGGDIKLLNSAIRIPKRGKDRMASPDEIAILLGGWGGFAGCGGGLPEKRKSLISIMASAASVNITTIGDWLLPISVRVFRRMLFFRAFWGH
jgi:hypothetical protein